MSSWDEDLRKYVAEKSNPPDAFRGRDANFFYTRSLGLRSRNTHDYNIVNNEASSPEAEKRYLQNYREKVQNHMGNALQKFRETAYHTQDIIHQQPEYPGVTSDQLSHMVKEERGKRIEPMSFQSSAQYALQPECWVRTGFTKQDLIEDKRKEKRAQADRDWNIITHHYVKNDTQTMKDKEQEKKRVAAAAMSASRFNPITAKYRNIDDEKKTVASEEKQKERLRREARTRTYHVPSTIKTSDGFAFDVITGQMYHQAQADEIERARVKGMPQRALLQMQWQQQRDLMEDVALVHQKRAENRYKHEKRNAQIMNRKYDIITNGAPLSDTQKNKSEKCSEIINNADNNRGTYGVMSGFVKEGCQKNNNDIIISHKNREAKVQRQSLSSSVDSGTINDRTMEKKFNLPSIYEKNQTNINNGNSLANIKTPWEKLQALSNSPFLPIEKWEETKFARQEGPLSSYERIFYERPIDDMLVKSTTKAGRLHNILPQLCENHVAVTE